jgi:hypothetical protein
MTTDIAYHVIQRILNRIHLSQVPYYDVANEMARIICQAP